MMICRACCNADVVAEVARVVLDAVTVGVVGVVAVANAASVHRLTMKRR